MICYGHQEKIGSYYELNGHCFCESCLESEIESMEEIAEETKILDCGHEVIEDETYYRNGKHTSCRDCLEIEEYEADYNPFEH